VNKFNKGLYKALEELGKHFLNVGVAVVVFAILKPIIDGKFKPKIALYFFITYLLIVVTSTVFLVFGGRNE